MLSEDAIREAVTALFPVVGASHSLELAAPLAFRDEALVATLRLVVRDDGKIRDVKEQEVELLPARHRTARGLAFLERIAHSVGEIPVERVELVFPHDLFPMTLLDAPIEVDVVDRVLADPRAQHILWLRPDDQALLATLAQGASPCLANPDLEARIFDAPRDRDRYAVYGDWLSERGDPRGELIAIQLALEATPENETLRAREAALLHEHAYEWLGTLAWRPAITCTWRRGFVRSIEFALEDPYESENTIDGAVVVRTIAALQGTQFLARVALGSEWNDSAITAIAKHGLFASVVSLALTTQQGTDLGDLEPAYPQLARIEELRLESPAVNLGAIDLPALRSFEIVTRGLTRDNLASMNVARWPHLERLVLWLGDEGLHDCDVELEDLAWILAGENLGRLRELGLCGREPAALLEHLVDSAILPRLDTLDLAGGYLDDADLEFLRENAHHFAHLQTFKLPRGLRDAAALANLGANVEIDTRFIPVYE